MRGYRTEHCTSQNKTCEIHGIRTPITPMTNFNFILERLSSRAKNALIAAQMVSEEQLCDHIGTEHLLYGIIAEKNSFAAEILSRSQTTPEKIKAAISGANTSRTASSWKPVLSENLKTAIERSAIAASQFGYQFIGTEHLLYGIVSMQTNTAKDILRNLTIDSHELEHSLLAVFENISRFPGDAPGENPPIQNPAAGPMPASPQQARGNMLEYFTTDLTKKAATGKIDPVIGRKKEIERITSILSRRTKNNPVLIGEAGVGKTAIVEGLALATSKREVPDGLLDKKILSLDLALVVAGSMFRGEFENRLKQIIDEAKADPDIVLFIDELHTMVGAGATQGSLDAANILKPALARGEVRIIGATTLAEYKKYIEHDAALERRFQSILVEEPSKAEALDILRGLRPSYEAHHNIEISDEALKAAVDLSSRYIQDHHLPDKAVDLIDETAAFLRSLHENSPALRQKKKVEADLYDLEEAKTKAVWQSDFVTAEHLKTQEAVLLEQKQLLESELKNERKKPSLKLSAEHIAHTVSVITKIPLDTLTKTEIGQLSNLETTLKAHIVGQDEAVTEVAKAIRRSRAGLHNPRRPLGSFIFLGPTGVGKTETAKVIAREVFHDEGALIRVDMSEFMERHNVARLIGAPAGYVGYEEGGRLTEAVRRKPYAVILFDEIEKAHRDVFNILLQILEDGILTDAQGKTVSFRNTIIIMTSNLGMQELNRQAVKIGFADRDAESQYTQKTVELNTQYDTLKQHVLEQVKRQFKPEFVNRIDKVLVFRPLGMQELRKITQLHLAEVSTRLKEKQLVVKFPASVVKFIAEQSFDPAQGARYIRKNIERLIEDPLAERMIQANIPPKSTINTDVDKGTISFHIEKARTRQAVAV